MICCQVRTAKVRCATEYNIPLKKAHYPLSLLKIRVLRTYLFHQGGSITTISYPSANGTSCNCVTSAFENVHFGGIIWVMPLKCITAGLAASFRPLNWFEYEVSMDCHSSKHCFNRSFVSFSSGGDKICLSRHLFMNVSVLDLIRWIWKSKPVLEIEFSIDCEWKVPTRIHLDVLQLSIVAFYSMFSDVASSFVHHRCLIVVYMARLIQTNRSLFYNRLVRHHSINVSFYKHY